MVSTSSFTWNNPYNYSAVIPTSFFRQMISTSILVNYFRKKFQVEAFSLVITQALTQAEEPSFHWENGLDISTSASASNKDQFFCFLVLVLTLCCVKTKHSVSTREYFMSGKLKGLGTTQGKSCPGPCVTICTCNCVASENQDLSVISSLVKVKINLKPLGLSRFKISDIS